MSKISLQGHRRGSHCGYCGHNGSSSYGLSCGLMRSSDYEMIMLKGWRRCGSYYYKPDIPGSCCKLNTIRCDAISFKPNKSQRKVSNKFEKFVNGIRSESEKKLKNKAQPPAELLSIVRESVFDSVQGLCDFNESFVAVQKNLPNRIKQFGNYSISSCWVIFNQNRNISKEALHSNLVSRISQKLTGSRWSVFNTKNFHVNLTDSRPEPELDQQEEAKMEVDLPKHEYSTEIVPADFNEESFQLYKQYQVAVHHDSPGSLSKSGYSNFLCGKNLIAEKPSSEFPLGLGNFHQLHRVDGKLVAVGVLDFLPSGISSVYFFYSPDYQSFSLGVLGALKEIELIQKNRTESFKYYYMGFYIDTCVKMRYKGEYLPSELLCPVNYVWVNIEKCLVTKTHNFLELHRCDENTRDQVNDDMNWTGVDFISFLQENMKIELNGKTLKIGDLNQNGQAYIISLMLEAQRFFSKSMIKRLVFKFS